MPVMNSRQNKDFNEGIQLKKIFQDISLLVKVISIMELLEIIFVQLTFLKGKVICYLSELSHHNDLSFKSS